MKKRILLTGARAPITLDLARQLKECGDTVYLADSVRTPLSRVSNAITNYFLLPKPVENPVAYVKYLNKIALENKIDLIIPTCEEIFYIARFKNLINTETDVFCDHFEKLYQLHSKWDFHKKITGYEVLSPETILLNHFHDIKKNVPKTIDYVFKPVFSRFASKTLISPNDNDLKNINISPPKPWVAQKRIYGKEYSSYSIAYRGNLSLHCTYQCQYRAGKGAGIYFEAIEHQKILNFVNQFVQENQFHGQISFDFIENHEHCYVLECNPRATSGLHLISHLKKLRDCFWGNQPTLDERPSTTKKMFGTAMLLYGLPKISSISKLKQFKDDWKQANDVIFHKEDIWPSFYQFYSLLDIIGTSFFTGRTIHDVTTSDIEYNGETI